MKNLIYEAHLLYPNLEGFYLTETFNEDGDYLEDHLVNISGLITAADGCYGNILLEPFKAATLAEQLYEYEFAFGWQAVSLAQVLYRNKKNIEESLLKSLYDMIVFKICSKELSKQKLGLSENMDEIEHIQGCLRHLEIFVDETGSEDDDFANIVIRHQLKELFSTTVDTRQNYLSGKTGELIFTTICEWSQNGEEEIIFKKCVDFKK